VENNARYGRRIRLTTVLAVLSALALPLTVSAQPVDGYQIEVYASGLSHPRGLTIDPDGRVVVGQQGTGEGLTGKISRIDEFADPLTGEVTTLARDIVNQLPSTLAGPGGNQVIGPSGVAYSEEGVLHFVTGNFLPAQNVDNFMAVWSTATPSSNPLSQAAPYAHIWEYQHELHPDSVILYTNPYDIVMDAVGHAYVTDAGYNAAYKVAPDGTVSTFGLYPDVPNPNGGHIEAVPTGLTWGPDGALYVAFLTGYPYIPGSGQVLRYEDTNQDGDATDDGEVSIYAEGFTTVTAIAFDQAGDLLATEFHGFLMDMPDNTGRLVKWHDGEIEVLVDGLSSPTGLTVGWDDSIYVTQDFYGMIMKVTETSH
jgi:hypothetical protein